MALQRATLSTSGAPGRRLWVFYDGDDHWHERLLLWPGSPTAWAVLTPDNDLYVEELEGINGPRKTQMVGLDGRLPRVSSGLRVLFAAPLGDNVLNQNVVRGKAAAQEFSDDFGFPKPLVTEAYNWSGDAVDVGAIQKRRAAVPGYILPRAVQLPLALGTSPVDVKGSGKGGAPVAGEEDAQVLGPPIGRTWVTSEPSDKYALGDVVALTSSSAVCDNKGVLFYSIGGMTGWVTIELIDVGDVDGYPALRRALFADQTSTPRADVVAPEGGVLDDMRTLPCAFDSQGDRFMEWREVASLVTEDEFKDWPLEGPRTMLWLTKFWSRQGTTPRQWLSKYLSEHKYSETDRSSYELRVLAEVMEKGGSYDCLNVASLASFELIARRWQLILEAHSSNPLYPDYEGHDLYTGLERSTGIAPQLTRHVATKMKDEAEVHKQRNKARESRGLPSGPKGSGKGEVAKK
jgi:hypothetical protein